MTKYLVKKEFKHTNGNTWTEGESYDADADHNITKFLINNGFIEEVKKIAGGELSQVKHIGLSA